MYPLSLGYPHSISLDTKFPKSYSAPLHPVAAILFAAMPGAIEMERAAYFVFIREKAHRTFRTVGFTRIAVTYFGC
jgi:hypothetical protein